MTTVVLRKIVETLEYIFTFTAGAISRKAKLERHASAYSDTDGPIVTPPGKNGINQCSESHRRHEPPTTSTVEAKTPER